ncbi:AzlC family ABC transporter permease [Cytobacillus spongiae]|uniref:AzlC family ABC transporter permease n=1 Tax=Cytobacillus spongiae TaxID=2901381 RepID=UPI001F2EA9DC|nr:AzlC family ABC transporter permease [Cytobacillus spongiae]UII56912.1 AzlC family ABC transporter permease [Cytobacillus spongiae]
MAEAVMGKHHSDFKRGFQSGISIGIGYFPVALTFGLLAKTTGLTLTETVLMSLFVFAGASQYISLSLLTLGTGIFEIILTTFIVNIRHFLMGTALNEKSEDEPVVNQLIYSFGITDETFSVASMKDGVVTTGYMLGVISISYSSWVINSGIGHLIGANLPKTLQESMSVALYAMFVGLLVPSLKKSTKVLLLALIAAAFHTIFSMLQLMSTGWAIVVATLLSAVLVEVVETLRKKKRGVISNEQ